MQNSDRFTQHGGLKDQCTDSNKTQNEKSNDIHTATQPSELTKQHGREGIIRTLKVDALRTCFLATGLRRDRATVESLCANMVYKTVAQMELNEHGWVRFQLQPTL